MNPARHGWAPFLPVAVALAVIATRPYRGIVHDAVLYTAQAIRSAGAPGIEGDLVFAFGNQQGFSIFDTLYGVAVSSLGTGMGHLSAVLAAAVLWLGALWWLLSVLGLGQWRPVLMIAVLLLPAGYGNGVLSYGERFASPRIFSEAAAMASLALVLGRRFLFSAVFLGLSAAMHPLMALPAAGVALRLTLPRGPWFWVILGGGAALIVALALGRVAPFDWVLVSYEPDWAQMVRNHARMVFLEYWPLHLAAHTLPGALALLAVLLSRDDRAAELARAVLVIGALGVVLSLVGGSVLENRFLTALQPWRALWLVALAGNAAIALLAFDNPSSRWWLAALALGVVEHVAGHVPVATALAAFAALLAGAPPRAARLLAGVLTALAGIVLVSKLVLDPPMIQVWAQLAFAGVSLSLALGLWVSPRPAVALAASLSLLVAGGYWLADARTAWDRFADSPEIPAEIAKAARGKTIYWEGGLKLSWFGLRQANHYACQHKAGLLFFREQGEVFVHRSRAFAPLDTGDFTTNPLSDCAPRAAAKPPTAEAFANLCRMLPELDLLAVLDQPPFPASDTWDIPVPSGTFRDGLWFGPTPRDTGATRWYVVECGSLRQ